MYKPIKDYEWNLLGIYNYKKPGKFQEYFKFIKSNISKKGDLFEAGVYNGFSLLSVALFLKEMGSNKVIYGFDSFSGFPPIISSKDKIINFKKMYQNKTISKKHYDDVILSNEIIKKLTNKKINSVNKISSSGAFSNTSKLSLQKKIKFLGLKNVKLIDGAFADTMINFKVKNGFLSGIFDCDLYSSYKTCFQYLWPLLNDKGHIYLDEYYSLKFPGARIACNEFLEKNTAKLIKYKNYSSLDFERWGIQKI